MPPLSLGGLAGTGKSEIVACLANDVWHKVQVVTLCGKAANVLRERGVPAKTIHSTIYCPKKDGRGQLTFQRRSRLEGIETLIVDEASMVDQRIYHDLLSFHLPILLVGDHGQLESVGTGANLMHQPDVLLKEIHRQAKENPVLHLAHAFREGRQVKYWADPQGRLRVVPKLEFEQFLDSDAQFICGFNKTRHLVNVKIRRLRGYTDSTPHPGERIIFLRNNNTLGLFNGQQATVRAIIGRNRSTIGLEVETDNGEALEVRCLIKQFGNNPISNDNDRKIVLADFAYCLTAHKAQGSEYDCVVALEEISPKWDPRRWRYTVATRAKERLIYCADQLGP
jgi:exodeoxyribonuclease-5